MSIYENESHSHSWGVHLISFPLCLPMKSNQLAFFNLLITQIKRINTIKAPEFNSGIKCSGLLNIRRVLVAILYDRKFWWRLTFQNKQWSTSCRERVGREIKGDQEVYFYMQWESVFQHVSSLHSLNKSFKITAAPCVGFTLWLWSLKHKECGRCREAKRWTYWKANYLKGKPGFSL